MACVIGFDYGDRRIGVAVGSIEVGTANPLTTIQVPAMQILWDEIDQIIKEWKPTTLIVGCVEHSSQGTDNLKTKIFHFCNNLKSRYHLPVETVDESYTSAMAYEILKDMRSKGQRKKINKTDIDKASATIILNSWLSTHLDQNKSHTHD